uniref:Protein YLS3-like n=1 Tax=Tanacetum cinerariifolium TaxID=118510 RepID=A0A699H901_TANCI|nr:protein YLS3-like [Tanacetum cinerariifolium]
MALHRLLHVHVSFVLVILTLALTSRVTLGADDKDKEECTEQLVGLATCLPYVGGNAKSPTPDCCTGLKQVLNTNKKCLCVVIKDRNDPDLGLTINVTLALGLPDVCHTPANVTKCPGLFCQRCPGTKKKASKRRQKRTAKNNDEGTRCIPWTPEEELHCAKGWVRISEDGAVSNTRKVKGFLTKVLGYVEQAMKIVKNERRCNFPNLKKRIRKSSKDISHRSLVRLTTQSREGSLISMIWLETRRCRKFNQWAGTERRKASASSIQPASLAVGSDESLARLLVIEYASQTESFMPMKK